MELILIIAQIVFFLGFGISHFVGNKTLSDITAVAAIVVGVLLLLNALD